MGFRGATVGVLAAGVAAVGFAAPAWPADDISRNAIGTYDAVYPWAANTWVVTPCQDDADQCVHVTEYEPGDTERKYPGWSANAYWQVGWWMIQGPMNYTWDAATGEGLRSYHDPGLCGDAYNGANELTVRRVGPAPTP